MASTKQPVKLELAPERREYVMKALDRGITPSVIARGYQRQFGVVLRPQEIELLRQQVYTPQQIEQKKNVEDIRSKLPSHDRQLEFARALIEEKMRNPDISAVELATLAREYRSNITASQQLASMSVTGQNDVQFVLIYGDQVKDASQKADIEDAKFTLIEDDDG